MDPAGALIPLLLEPRVQVQIHTAATSQVIAVPSQPMESLTWYWLRLSRSEPPDQASGDEQRGKLYRSALRQFEELMRAAEATGPAARPLPLFYALSQAGRAIVAAKGGADPKGHGLRLRKPAESPLETLVYPIKGGALGAVAKAVGSPTLAQPVEIGALVYSMPELGGTVGANLLLDSDERWPRPLFVWPEPPSHPKIASKEWIRTGVVFDVSTLIETPGDLRRELDHYPAARGRWESVGSVLSISPLPAVWTPWGRGEMIDWTASTGGLDAVAPEYRWLDRRWLRPEVVPGEEPPSPLMTWWTILFALSMFARYYPVAWVQALDPDSSPIAVPLERTMSEALEAVPHLVLEALAGQPWLLPAPPLR
jgi:hypothetical protein